MPRLPEDREDDEMDDDPRHCFAPIAPVRLNVEELRRRINSLAINRGQSILLRGVQEPPKRWGICKISNWPSGVPFNAQVLFSIVGATRLLITAHGGTEFISCKPTGWKVNMEFLAVIQALQDFDPRIKVEYT